MNIRKWVLYCDKVNLVRYLSFFTIFSIFWYQQISESDVNYIANAQKSEYLPCCKVCSFKDPPPSMREAIDADSLITVPEFFEDACIGNPRPLPPIGPPLRDPRGRPRLLAPRTECRIRALAPMPRAKWCPSRATLDGGSPNWWRLRDLPPETTVGPSTSTTSPSLLVSSCKKNHQKH